MTSVSMKVTFSKTNHKLILTYEVTNGSKGEIYLQNVLVKQGTNMPAKIDADAVLISLDGATAHIMKKKVPLPTATPLTLPVNTFLTPVAVGKTFTETLEIPLPLVPWNPYLDACPKPPFRQKAATGFIFSLNYREASPHSELGEMKRFGQKVFYLKMLTQSPEGGAPTIKTLTSERFEIDIPVEIPNDRNEKGEKV